MMKSIIKKESQFVFVILNASLSGAILGVALQHAVIASSAPTFNRVVGFLVQFLIVALILGISTRYYTKMK